MDKPKQVFYPGENYWISGDDGTHLIGSHCRKCGENYFPPREICPKCFSRNEMDRITLSSTGRLYSYSIVHVAPKRFSTPYGLGYVDFPEKVRVLGQLTTADPTILRPDMQVQTEIGKIGVDEQGNEIISYKFKPL